ncbi:MAG: hypothetical protein ACOVMM_09520, partial [Chitinophagaceae bacterium]
MKKFIFCLHFVCICFPNLFSQAWVELPNVNTGYYEIKYLNFDARNNLYFSVLTPCFGEGVNRYRNFTTTYAAIGCDNTEVSRLIRDENGKMYAAIYNRIGFSKSFYKFTETSTETFYASSSISPWLDTLALSTIFSVKPNGLVYATNTSKVYEFNPTTNLWTNLAGAGADTLPSGIIQRNLLALNNNKLLISIDNGSNYELYIWDGMSWKLLAPNAGYLNSTKKITDFLVNKNGELFGFALNTFNSTKTLHRALWNNATNSWIELLPNSNNPYADTCIKIKTIVQDKFNNYYGISSCANSFGREFVAKWNGNSWQQLGNLTNNNIIHSIAVDTIGNVFAAGRFTNTNNELVIVKYDVVTPVKFGSFDVNASLKDNQTFFTFKNKWTTLSETNAAFFNVQISIDNKEFKTVGKVFAKNSSYNEYEFSYSLPLDGLGVVYFRIEAVDKDGSKTY